MSTARNQFRLAREFAYHACQPFVEQIMRVRLNERPSYVVTNTGLELISDGLSDREHSIISDCKEHIRDIHEHAAKLCGMPYTLPESEFHQ